jgi:AmiR/NasT family two-component response regulator
MTRKRVILANGPRLLREMLQRVIEKAEHLTVVQEVPDQQDLPSAIERLDPEWVILSIPYNQTMHSWIEACLMAYPTVRFMFLAPESSSIKMKGQSAYEEDLTNLSLKDFIDILERDLQHT